jgi:TM2 domain-containing membrane protein YozV
MIPPPEAPRYFVIGSDGRTYGPESREQIIDWIRAGLCNGMTSARLDGAPDWRPLGHFPEFTPTLATQGLATSPPPAGTLIPSPHSSTKLAAGICGILLGALGIHKFVLGYTGPGLIMLLVSVLSCGIAAPVISIIGLIEGIIYLTKSDEEFGRLYVENRKEWF